MLRMVWALTSLALMFGAGQVKADYVYVGSWDLATIDGGYGNSGNPFLWSKNPQVYSGVGAAAMLFGGAASDYVISTADSDPAHINRLAFVDGYGDSSYLMSPASDTYSLSSRSDGGYDQYPSFSAYVVDHAPGMAPYHFVNYAFREEATAAVPEPSSHVLMAMAFCGIGIARRQKRKHTATACGGKSQ